MLHHTPPIMRQRKSASAHSIAAGLLLIVIFHGFKLTVFEAFTETIAIAILIAIAVAIFDDVFAIILGCIRQLDRLL